MFYKKAVHKNFAIFKVASDAGSVKVFLVVYRARKVTCFYIDQKKV